MFAKNVSGSMLAVLVGAVLLLQISEGSAASKFVGKYKYISDPEDPPMQKLFLALGSKDSDLPKIAKGLEHSQMEIKHDGPKVTVIWTTPPDKRTEKTFESGQTIDEIHVYKPVTQTTVTLKSDTEMHYVRTAKSWKDTLYEDFICDDKGCASHYSIGDLKAVARWIRLLPKGHDQG